MRGIFLIEFTFFILFSTMAAATTLTPLSNPHTPTPSSSLWPPPTLEISDAAQMTKWPLPTETHGSASGEGELVACEILTVARLASVREQENY